VPCVWRWADFYPQIVKAAQIVPIEFTERRSFLFMNPGLGGDLKVTNTMRSAYSFYNPGDIADVHLHTPNASRLILQSGGGYTTVEGERCDTGQGDLILTPNGTWHNHGNDGDQTMIWMDILDTPIMEVLDIVWIRHDYAETSAESNSHQPLRRREQSGRSGLSQKLYASGGFLPQFVSHQRGSGQATSPLFVYKGEETRRVLDRLRDQDGSPHEGIIIEFVNPVTGKSVLPTLSYHAQLLRPAEQTLAYRHTAATVYCCTHGRGYTEVNGLRLDWDKNDVLVVPPYMWRKHVNLDPNGDAVLYSTTDAPILKALGQYRQQGMSASGEPHDIAN
jgi:gentisate 1,2-dioxygenase